MLASSGARPTMHRVKDRWTELFILSLSLCCSMGQVTIGFSDTTIETINEGATVTKDVCRDFADPTTNAVLFSLTVSRNTGQDVILPSGNSLIPAGMRCVAVEISAFDDSMREDTETFQISLSLPFPSTVDIDENQNQFILYIEDSDGTGTFNFCPFRTLAIFGVIVLCPNNAVATSVCTYQCFNGYKVVAGLLTRTCIPDTLRWTGNPPVCAPSSAPSTPVIINNCPTSPLTHTVSSNLPLPAFFNAPVPTTTDISTRSVTGVPVNNLFPEGSTFITYTFTNDAGSQAVCIFTIVIDVDYCNPRPVVCQTGTTCVEGSPDQSQITCVVTPCDPNPCINGGTCNPTGNTFFCLCDTGFSGATCDMVDSDPCTPNPCMGPTEVCLLNNGVVVCSDLCDGFTCMGATEVCMLNNGAPQCTGDTTSPEIVSCPSEVFRTVQLQVQSISVTWEEPTARDDSMSVSISSQSHMPGSNFNVGRTTVTYIFSDPAGNTAECSFGVSVVQDCTVLYSNRQCDAGTCTCIDESCDLDTGVCRSSCTVMDCPADIESVSLSEVNPLSSVDITCTLRGSTAVLRQLQLRLSNKLGSLDLTGIRRLTGTSVNPVEKVENTFKVDHVTRETKLYCVLLQQADVIGGVGVMDFVNELPVLNAAPFAKDVSSTLITIGWRDWDLTMDNGDPPIVAYIPYYRRNASDVWMGGPRILMNETLQFTAAGLEVDTLYKFSVAVVREGGNGEGPKSQPVTVKTFCNVPDVPVSINVQLTSSNKVSVSWQLPPGGVMCSTGVTGYKVYYSIEGSIDDNPQLAGTVEDADTTSLIVDDGLLEPGTSYIFFVTVTTDQESGFRESEAIQAPADTSSPVYLISLIIIPVLLITVIVVFIIKRKNIFKDKKATKADDGDGTDYVNTAMIDDPEDYIPLEEQFKTVSSSKYEDLNLKPQGGASIPTQYEVTIVPQPQKPEAASRYQTRNVKGVNSGAYEDVGVSSENRQLPDVPRSHPSAGDKDAQDNSYEVPDKLEEYAGVYINIKAKPVQPGPIKVAEFQNFMRRKKEDVVNDIVQQFMALTAGGQYPCSVALKFQNKPRNFFKTILA